jgi:hypothetical protein
VSDDFDSLLGGSAPRKSSKKRQKSPKAKKAKALKAPRQAVAAKSKREPQSWVEQVGAGFGQSLGAQVGLSGGKRATAKAKSLGKRAGAFVKAGVSAAAPYAGKVAKGAGVVATAVAVLQGLGAINRAVIDAEARRMAGGKEPTAAQKEKAAREINRLAALNSSEGR